MKQTAIFDVAPKELPIGPNRFILYWNSKENIRHHRNLDSSVCKEAKKRISLLVSGDLFTNRTNVSSIYWKKRFSFMHFQRAVDQFAKKAYRYPALQKMNLSDFLYNPFAQRNCSQFLSCLEESLKASIPCQDTPLLYAVVKAYALCSNASPDFHDYPQYVMDLFVKATNNLNECLGKTKDLHVSLMLRNVEDKADLLIRAAKHCAKGDIKKITPGYISSSWVKIAIPLFMRNQGYLKSPASFSIYNRR